jgi:hypothetical protein
VDASKAIHVGDDARNDKIGANALGIDSWYVMLIGKFKFHILTSYYSSVSCFLYLFLYSIITDKSVKFLDCLKIAGYGVRKCTHFKKFCIAS